MASQDEKEQAGLSVLGAVSRSKAAVVSYFMQELCIDVFVLSSDYLPFV